jgi:GT2 family glycosyltransferase
MMRTALVIPTIGADSLAECLQSVRLLKPAPDETVVVHSGGSQAPCVDGSVQILNFSRRLGFADAVNTGIAQAIDRADAIAVLNDDAFPASDWLGRLHDFLESRPRVAAVQGTVRSGDGSTIDGRGVALSRFGLPMQVDQNARTDREPAVPARRTAVSATAALYRADALQQTTMVHEAIFDPAFDSYHEDVDLGLRLGRLGWQSWFVPGAVCRHLGSHSGAHRGWRHPWWLLANPWRVLAGNLDPRSTMLALPRMLVGELRAAARMTLDNPRTALVVPAVLAAMPALLASGWRRQSAGPRLTALPMETA